MTEPWKAIICDSERCREEMHSPVSPGSRISKLNQDTIEDYKIYPDIDNEVMTQFTCRRCGKVHTWGVTRRAAVKALYEWFKNADVDR